MSFKEDLDKLFQIKAKLETMLKQGHTPAYVLQKALTWKYLGGIFTAIENDVEYVDGFLTEENRRILEEARRLKRQLEQLVVEKALKEQEGLEWRFRGLGR